MTLEEFARKLEAVEPGDSSMWDIYLTYKAQLERAQEAERRVRWLEGVAKTSAWVDPNQDPCRLFAGDVCRHCGTNLPRKHRKNCALFLPDGTPKPTPEDFE